MGKKVKIGKFRKDKFYELAKEAGYRSRAAFKLLQLNRTYHFLEKSRVCIDLCAAPGGWLQVAATHMPVSSVIIGVDLAPIKSIANVITHQEDITSDKCRSLLKKDLNEMKADIVLHDGAPNVGKNWLFDAYQQNMLVLQSFKLAAEFLKKGGCFITKVFRSKDYYSIMWVLQQFFKKVESTKPQASRNESAEIFVVCQNFKAPDRIDPKFFDIKFVFSEVENASDKKVVDLFKNDMNQRHRGGYPEGDLTLYHKLKASEFVSSENFVELLGKSNEIELDDPKIAKHPATTPEIKECIKDLKLLGKTDIKNLLKWRTTLKSELSGSGNNKEILKLEVEKNSAEVKENADKEGSDGDNEEQIEEEIKLAVLNEKKVDKKKKKKLQKEKQKLKQKQSLKMEFSNDIVDTNHQGDNEIFSLDKIKTKKQLMDLHGTLPGLDVSDDEFNETDFRNAKKKKKATTTFSKFDQNNDLHDNLENGKDSENEEEVDDGFDDDLKYSDQENDENQETRYDDEEDNPLLVDLVSRNSKEKKNARANMWFNKDTFDFLKDSTAEENRELLKGLELEEKINKPKPDLTKFDGDEDQVGNKSTDVNSDFDDDDFSDSDNSDGEEGSKKRKRKGKNKKNGEEESNANEKESSKRKLSPEELAIGETMVNSKKAKSKLIDDSYNRYSTFDDDDNLPKWFLEDEKINFKKPVPVSKEVVNEYKKKFEDINLRPIKKVVEAQARKKRRMAKKLDKARKKAEVISNNEDMTDKERNREMKAVYKKAGLLTKKKVEVKYITAKKGVRGRVLGKGVKGPYKIVDKRLKKDKNAERRAEKNSKKEKEKEEDK